MVASPVAPSRGFAAKACGAPLLTVVASGGTSCAEDGDDVELACEEPPLEKSVTEPVADTVLDDASEPVDAPVEVADDGDGVSGAMPPGH